MKVNIIQEDGHHYITVENTATLFVQARFNNHHEAEAFCCRIKKSAYRNFKISYIVYNIIINDFDVSITSAHPLDDAAIEAVLQSLAEACKERAPRPELKPCSPKPC